MFGINKLKKRIIDNERLLLIREKEIKELNKYLYRVGDVVYEKYEENCTFDFFTPLYIRDVCIERGTYLLSKSKDRGYDDAHYYWKDTNQITRIKPKACPCCGQAVE